MLDFDATDSLSHGNQEVRFFHGHHHVYCYLPLYCFIGPWPVWAQLRTSNRDASDGTLEALEIIVPLIHERFPEVRIIPRADRGFVREPIFASCELNGVFYVTGMAKNAALLRHLDATMFRAKADACVRGGWRILLLRVRIPYRHVGAVPARSSPRLRSIPTERTLASS